MAPWDSCFFALERARLPQCQLLESSRRAGGHGVSLFLPLLAVMDRPASLAAALMVFGASLGSLDVAMNLHAVEVERALSRPLMSGFHAVFSIGGFAGPGFMTLMLSNHISPFHSSAIGFHRGRMRCQCGGSASAANKRWNPRSLVCPAPRYCSGDRPTCVCLISGRGSAARLECSTAGNHQDGLGCQRRSRLHAVFDSHDNKTSHWGSRDNAAGRSQGIPVKWTDGDLLPMIIGAALALACGAAANSLLCMIRISLKGLLTVTATVILHQTAPRRMERVHSLWKRH
jgi:hypothetical protein